MSTVGIPFHLRRLMEIGAPVGDNDAARKVDVDDAVAEQVQVLTRDATLTIISNTTSESSLVSYSIPADTITDERGIRFSAFGYVRNNTASPCNYKFRAKIGSTTFFNANNVNTIASAAGSTIYPAWEMSGIVIGDGATNSQVSQTCFHANGADSIGNVNSSATFNIDLWSGGNNYFAQNATHRNIAEDSTGSLTLDIRVSMSAMNTACIAACMCLVVERL